MPEAPTMDLDVELLMACEDRGVSLMHQAIQRKAVLFERLVNEGWSRRLMRTHRVHDFFRGLCHLEDTERVKWAMRLALKDFDKDDVNSALLGKESNERPPMLAWFVYGTQRGSEREQRTRSLIQTALEIGVDPHAEFSHSAGRMPNQRHSLMSAFIGETWEGKSIAGSSIPGHRDRVIKHCASSFHNVDLLLESGVRPDRAVATMLLKSLEPEIAMLWFQFLEERDALDAAAMLKQVARMKVEPERLAYLQARAAAQSMQAIRLTPRTGAAP